MQINLFLHGSILERSPDVIEGTLRLHCRCCHASEDDDDFSGEKMSHDVNGWKVNAKLAIKSELAKKGCNKIK